jgi:hypothetical protein
MDYALIGKIEKAKMYASEPERFHFDAFEVRISGDNDQVHVVKYNRGAWECDCGFFETRTYCSHSMAMERVLGTMLPESAMQS